MLETRFNRSIIISRSTYVLLSGESQCSGRCIKDGYNTDILRDPQ